MFSAISLQVLLVLLVHTASSQPKSEKFPRLYGKLGKTHVTYKYSSDSSEESTSCTGFICNNITTYTTCDGVGQEGTHNCPQGTYCNTKCNNPCTADIRFC